MAARKKTALLVVDLQRDFVAGGSLAVPHGEEVVGPVNALLERDHFAAVVFTKDWHPPGHASFASSHPGRSPFEEVRLPSGAPQTLWPDHCVQGTPGAEFVDGLRAVDGAAVVEKGTKPDADSYSGFWDNERANQTELEQVLRQRGIEKVVVCGLATDYCVGYTALDALSAGFETVVLEDASRGIDAGGVQSMLARIEKAGGQIAKSDIYLA